MVEPVATESEPPIAAKRRFRLRYSLRTLLLLVLLVAVFFAGRESGRVRFWFPPGLTGTWQAKLPAGYQRTATVKDLGSGRFVLSSGASIFNGIYEWQSGQLVVVQPSDQRMQGLVWQWDNDELVLVSEPTDTPTGASYVGTTLTKPRAGK